MKLAVNTSRGHLALVKVDAGPSDDERAAESLRLLRSWSRAKERLAIVRLAEQVAKPRNGGIA